MQPKPFFRWKSRFSSLGEEAVTAGASQLFAVLQDHSVSRATRQGFYGLIISYYNFQMPFYTLLIKNLRKNPSCD